MNKDIIDKKIQEINNDKYYRESKVIHYTFYAAYITLFISALGGILFAYNFINLDDGLDGEILKLLKEADLQTQFFLGIGILFVSVVVPIFIINFSLRHQNKYISKNHLIFFEVIKTLNEFIETNKHISENLLSAPVSNLIKFEHSHNYEINSEDVFAFSYTLDWLNWVNKETNKKRAIEIISELIINDNHRYYFMLHNTASDNNKELITNAIEEYKSLLRTGNLYPSEIDYLRNLNINNNKNSIYKDKFIEKALKKYKSIKTILTNTEYEIVNKILNKETIINKIINNEPLNDNEINLLNIESRYKSIVVDINIPLPNDFAIYKNFIRDNKYQTVAVINTGGNEYDILFYDKEHISRMYTWFVSIWNDNTPKNLHII